MNGKTGWFCYAKKSGCDILDKKMKSKNVSLVLKFIPERGRKPVVACIPRLADGLKFIPERGRKLHGGREKIQFIVLKFIPERGRKQIRVQLLCHYAG